MEQEQWKPIEWTGGLYDVSNYGRVMSHQKKTPAIIAQRVNNYGYVYVSIKLKGKKHSVRVNRLVALAFIPNPDNLSDVNHKDMNKLNNHVSNLEWTSHSDNVQHSYDSGKRHAHRWTDEEKVMISQRMKDYRARQKAGLSF